MNYIIVLLHSSHKKEHFTCGKPLLDNYLHAQASQDVKRKLAACFALVDGTSVQGYFTLSNSSIPKETLPDELKKKLPAYKNLPVTLLGRLAVDHNSKGRGIGEFLLMDAL